MTGSHIYIFFELSYKMYSRLLFFYFGSTVAIAIKVILTKLVNPQAIHSGAKEHADAVHPRAVDGVRRDSAGGQVHHRTRLPGTHGEPHQGLADQHRTHQASLRAARPVQTAR